MYALLDDTIKKNKESFINILSNAVSERPGCDLEGLLNKLESSDFYIAPASTKYHGAYKGGLVDHSLNVYYNMLSLAKNKRLLAIHKLVPEDETIDISNVDETTKMKDIIIEGEIEADSIAIVALLHDFSKMNYYKLDYRNKKVYCESGSKHENNGRFDWVTVPSYITAPQEERFLYGSHEETSEFMIRQFIPLTYQESTAVLHHHFALGFDSIKDVGVVSNIYNRYPIATLLHLADCLACYVDERY